MSTPLPPTTEACLGNIHIYHQARVCDNSWKRKWHSYGGGEGSLRKNNHPDRFHSGSFLSRCRSDAYPYSCHSDSHSFKKHLGQTADMPMSSRYSCRRRSDSHSFIHSTSSRRRRCRCRSDNRTDVVPIIGPFRSSDRCRPDNRTDVAPTAIHSFIQPRADGGDGDVVPIIGPFRSSDRCRPDIRAEVVPTVIHSPRCHSDAFRLIPARDRLVKAFLSFQTDNMWRARLVSYDRGSGYCLCTNPKPRAVLTPGSKQNICASGMQATMKTCNKTKVDPCPPTRHRPEPVKTICLQQTSARRRPDHRIDIGP